MGLNEPQRRRLEVTLSLIEQTLFELEACYFSGEAAANGESARVKNDLTEAEIAQLVNLFNQMRRQIDRMRQQFQLKPQTHDLRRLLAAKFAHFWAILHDCRTSKLKGTGAVDPRLKHSLDPAVDQLIELAKVLEAAIEGDGKT